MSEQHSPFKRLLVNTLVANVTTTFLSFALAFWVYLVTESVLVASIVSGSSMLAGALFGAVFGAIVDANRKKTAMVISSSVTGVAFAAAGVVYLMVPVADWTKPWFWVFAALVLIGSLAGSLRSIALATTVTLLVPADRRDGLFESMSGIARRRLSIVST